MKEAHVSKKPLVYQDAQLRKAWWNLHRTGEYQTAFEVGDPEKLDFLRAVYGELYGELREKHARQQQIVAWGFTILSGGGFISLAISDTSAMEAVIAFSVSLASLTFALTRTIRFLSEDRMSIARQLDRIHQILGAFREDFYCKGTTLFDPIWYGWGFDKRRDVNWQLSKVYQVVLWLLFATDVLILMSKAGLISIF
jgi:hypothetical protein